MNYQKIYDSLVEKAKTRSLEGYFESHHIVPKCMGGSDDPSNLVKLTPEEHYLAHALLVKINPDNYKILLAVKIMCSGDHKTKRSKNKLYGWLRRKIPEGIKKMYEDRPDLRIMHSERMKKDNPMKRDGVAQRVAETRRQKGNLGRGNTPLSEEERAAISKRMKKNNPCAGIPPWRSPKATSQSIEVWREADEYYQWWVVNKKGYCAMASAFGFKEWLASHASMIKRFKSGWIPKEDPDWLSWLV